MVRNAVFMSNTPSCLAGMVVAGTKAAGVRMAGEAACGHPVGNPRIKDTSTAADCKADVGESIVPGERRTALSPAGIPPGQARPGLLGL